MKKYISIVAILLVLIPAISFASFDTNLSYGTRGQAVVDLQNILISKGFLNTQASGNFYAMTKQAVIAYQASLGLPTTGFVGPMTRQKINAELSSRVTPSVVSGQSVSNSTAVLPVSVGSTIAPVQGSVTQTQSPTPVIAATSDSTLTPELQSIIAYQQQKLKEMVAQSQNQQVQTANKPTGTGVTQAMIDQLEQDLSRQSGSPVSLSRDSVDPSATCIETPNLVFQTNRPIHSSSVTILAIYDTGCPVNQNVTWSLSDGNTADYTSGTLGSGAWNFGKENGSVVNNVAFFYRTIQTASTNLIMIVGTTTVQSTVGSQ